MEDDTILVNEQLQRVERLCYNVAVCVMWRPHLCWNETIPMSAVNSTVRTVAVSTPSSLLACNPRAIYTTRPIHPHVIRLSALG